MTLFLIMLGSVLAGYGGLMVSKGDEFGSMLIALGVYLAAMGAAHSDVNKRGPK